ncbi:MAG TPA: hypothetical protein VJH92_00680 [Candidatus Nanoarchaeia archaeon]|nr:hypothetical protein [Candidatus Nanoarchaeia archaeon]
MQLNSEIYSSKLGRTSKEFRTFFLLNFTKEIVKHYKLSDIGILETIIKEKIKPKKKDEFDFLEKEYGEMIPSIMSREPVRPHMFKQKPALIFPTQQSQSLRNQQTQFAQTPAPPQSQNFRPKQMPAVKRTPEMIPDSQLPPQLQYIKPVPVDVQIDLGRLNNIISNPETISVECNGAEEPLKIKNTRGVSTSNINLNKEEIMKIIQNFSEMSKIPAHEGIFKVAVGNFIISSVISDVVGSRFIIRKIQTQQRMPTPRYPGYS